MPPKRTLLSTILGAALLLPLFGATTGCLVRTEPHRHYRRDRDRGHYRCHQNDGPHRKRVCRYERY